MVEEAVRGARDTVVGHTLMRSQYFLCNGAPVFNQCSPRACVASLAWASSRSCLRTVHLSTVRRRATHTLDGPHTNRRDRRKSRRSWRSSGGGSRRPLIRLHAQPRACVHERV
jgi:hypothetical protein